MSHQSQLDFVAYVKSLHPNSFENSSVLEIGSLDINGSIRQFFTNCNYIGVDLGVGPGVDLIAKGEDLTFDDGRFDVCASCECFEHNEHWMETFINMHRMTKTNGLIFFSCATTGRPEHGTIRTSPADAPFCHDYYRNLTEQDFSLLSLNEMFIQYEFLEKHPPHDLYFVGIKK
jgi:SAM-dependent methyltransferase